MAGCGGTSPKEVLDARGDLGSSPQPAPTSRDQPRKVTYSVQGDRASGPRITASRRLRSRLVAGGEDGGEVRRPETGRA